jgi:transcriptional regulator with XRE-family HTH domain
MSRAATTPDEIAYLRDFGLRLRLLRVARHLGQGDLAERSGLSRVYIGALERGVNGPNLIVLRRLAQALDLTTAELVDERTLRVPPIRRPN